MIGLIISLMLLLWHYNPQINIEGFSCGSNSGCGKLVSSNYSTFLNIPLPFFGIYLYIFTLYTSIIQLVINYNEEMNRLLDLVFLYVYMFVLFADLVLFSKMIQNDAYCLFCLGTYVVNLILFIIYLIMVIMFSSCKIRFLFKQFGIFKNKDVRAISIIYLVSIFLMIPAVDSINIYIRSHAARKRSTHVLNNNISDLAKKTTLDTSFLQDSLISIGSKKPVVTIWLFSDFLCSHCLGWHDIENRILEEYKDRVAIKYYLYPMDSRCNKYVTRTINQYSCEVNSAMILAAQTGLYDKLIKKYFKIVNRGGGRFSEKDLELVDDFFKNNGIKPDYRNNADIRDYLMKNIEYATRLAIFTTPTIIINNHPVRGLFEYDVYKRIIDSEIQKQKNKYR